VRPSGEVDGKRVRRARQTILGEALHVVGAAGRRDWPVTAERYRFRLAAVVDADARETVARDEVQASVGAPRRPYRSCIRVKAAATG
jgi:hypothetical protein